MTRRSDALRSAVAAIEPHGTPAPLRAATLASLIGLLTLPPVFPSGAAAADLTVKLDAPLVYRTSGGEQVRARYGRLSDDSLHFVKVTLPNGKEYTLPQALSGSGARYTDERELVWWEHHGKVRVELRGPDGAWQTKYEGLVPARQPR